MKISKTVWIATALALSLSALGVGCAAPTEADSDDAAEAELNAAPVVVGASDNRQTISVVAGQTLVVSLEKVDGLGAWGVTESSSLGTPKIGEISAQGDLAHRAPTLTTFTWKTKGKIGTHQLAFNRKQVALAPVPAGVPGFGPRPLPDFSITVNVTKAAAAPAGAPLGASCAGIQGIQCASGLLCLKSDGRIETGTADGIGKCRKKPAVALRGETGGACGGQFGGCNSAKDFCNDVSCGTGIGAGKCEVKPQFCPAVIFPGIFGCDGKQYNNNCDANAAGTSVSAKPVAACVRPIALPGFCLAQFEPVCGCDGVTYSNSCVANNQVTGFTDGACKL